MNLPYIIHTIGFENAEGAKENHSYTLQTGNIYISEDTSWYILYNQDTERWTLNDISQEYYYAFNMDGTWYYSSSGSQSEGYVYIPPSTDLKTSTIPPTDINPGSGSGSLPGSGSGSGSRSKSLDNQINCSYIYDKTKHQWIKK